MDLLTFKISAEYEINGVIFYMLEILERINEHNELVFVLCFRYSTLRKYYKNNLRDSPKISINFPIKIVFLNYCMSSWRKTAFERYFCQVAERINLKKLEHFLRWFKFNYNFENNEFFNNFNTDMAYYWMQNPFIRKNDEEFINLRIFEKFTNNSSVLKLKKCEILGFGSFGDVYRYAEDKNNKFINNYCVKEYTRPNKDKSDIFLLLNESEIMLFLNNINILKCYCRFVKRDPRCLEIESIKLLLEYCNQNNLKEYLKKYPNLSLEIKWNIICQILCGMYYLHNNKYGIIVHRDLKPENIMVHHLKFPESGLNNIVIKIGDFGNSVKILRNDFIFKEDKDLIVGTCPYQSPEIIYEKPYTSKCDIWSLGILFYYILYEKYPWNLENEPVQNQLKTALSQNSEIQFGLIENQNPLIKIKKLKEIICEMLEPDEKNRISWERLFESINFRTNEIQSISDVNPNRNKRLIIGFTSEIPKQSKAKSIQTNPVPKLDQFPPVEERYFPGDIVILDSRNIGEVLSFPDDNNMYYSNSIEEVKISQSDYLTSLKINNIDNLPKQDEYNKLILIEDFKIELLQFISQSFISFCDYLKSSNFNENIKNEILEINENAPLYLFIFKKIQISIYYRMIQSFESNICFNVNQNSPNNSWEGDYVTKNNLRNKYIEKLSIKLELMKADKIYDKLFDFIRKNNFLVQKSEDEFFELTNIHIKDLKLFNQIVAGNIKKLLIQMKIYLDNIPNNENNNCFKKHFYLYQDLITLLNIENFIRYEEYDNIILINENVLKQREEPIEEIKERLSHYLNPDSYSIFHL